MSKLIKRIFALIKNLWSGSINLHVVFNVFFGDVNIWNGGQASNAGSPGSQKTCDGEHIKEKRTNIGSEAIQKFLAILIIFAVLLVVFFIALGVIRLAFAVLPAASPFQHFQETGSFFADHNTRYISWAEIQSLYKVPGVSPRQAIQTEINSYYAEMGLVFSVQSGYRDFFCKWDWYTPDETVSEQRAWNSMSEYSKANIKLLSVARRLLS